MLKYSFGQKWHGMRNLGNTVALCAVMLLAAALRLTGVLRADPLWHPDEHFLVFWPLNFLSGDLNPHFFAYPTLQLYLVGLVYGSYFLWQNMFGTGWNVGEFAAVHYFWNDDLLLQLARALSVSLAVGTVWWVICLTRRIYGAGAAPIAGLLLAVCVIHVRQSPLAAVDVPMTFWFVATVWASVRLIDRRGPWDYVLAGIFTGLCGATKYPGLLAGSAVLAAHLSARRPLFHTHLGLAGLAAGASFSAVAPYLLIDYPATTKALRFLASYTASGHHIDLGSGAWFHLSVSLPRGLGWLSMLCAAFAVVESVRKRQRKVWIVLTAALVLYLFLAPSKAVFVRYAMPLMAIQAVIVAGAIQHVARFRWRVLLLLFVVAEPLYGSVRASQLHGATDTRTEARRWIESNLPMGSTCCNFGGWAGDVPLKTLENHWWRMKYYAANFGLAQLEASMPVLADEDPGIPYYSYVIQPGDRASESGYMRTVIDRSCEYVLLHRHPLSYSNVDSLFAQELPTRGKMLRRWVPRGAITSDPIYDPADAFYLPIGNFGDLRQSGPEIELWQVKRNDRSRAVDVSTEQLFGKGYVLWATMLLGQELTEQAKLLADKALVLEGDDFETLLVAGEIYSSLGRTNEAQLLYRRAINFRPEDARPYDKLGLLFSAMGEYPKAIEFHERSIRLAPSRALFHNNLGVAKQARGDREDAIRHWVEATRLDANNVDALYNLATAQFMRGSYEAAGAYFIRAIDLRPKDPKILNNAAWTFAKLEKYERAIEYWERALELDPGYRDLLSNIAFTYQNNLQDYQKAIHYWQRSVAAAPDQVTPYLQLVEINRQIGQNRDAERWAAKLQELHPDHPTARTVLGSPTQEQ
jgi:tetratricopeptide (TPR) repeat protein